MIKGKRMTMREAWYLHYVTKRDEPAAEAVMAAHDESVASFIQSNVTVAATVPRAKPKVRPK